jgi:two-component system nitrogen regulation sensor histidine kinase NtrY
MFKNVQNFKLILVTTFITIVLGIITFLTFINQSFIELNSKNIQFLLIADFCLLLFFFFLIIKNSLNLLKDDKFKGVGKQTRKRYVSIFCLFTFLPSLIIAVFSLFLFNFGLENFFNNQVNKAVTNSNSVAKDYLAESKKTLESDIVLMGLDLNRVANLFYANENQFFNIVKSQRYIRRVDDVYLIDSLGTIILSETIDQNLSFKTPTDDEFNLALEGKPVVISSEVSDKTSVMLKLENLIDTYLYISRNIEPKIINYLNETEEAVNFYYSVQAGEFGIKVTFALIYIIIVSLLVFLSITFAISFASGLTVPIINLITASEDISKGKLDTKVPNIEADDEIIKLNKNFNKMITTLKSQQEKLIATERFEAWETIARKMAHEIKNPLTPIQLSLDRIKEKYLHLSGNEKNNFQEYLDTINRQIKQIENLVNEFSNFARMPKPQFKKIEIISLIQKTVKFVAMSYKSSVQVKTKLSKTMIEADEDQINRLILNLIKNSEESVVTKMQKDPNFKGKIVIVIEPNNDYITITVEDNGMGFVNLKRSLNPYYTTKEKGSGLGLAIANKIMSEHNGTIKLKDLGKNKGAAVILEFPKSK